MPVPRLQHVASAGDPDGGWLDIGLAAGAEGGALHAAGSGDSSAIVKAGEPEVDEGVFAFAGQDGEFSVRHGVRGRQIDWLGNLRVSTAGFLAIRAAREVWWKKVGRMKFKDRFDVVFDNCRLLKFDIHEEDAQPIQNEPGLEIWVPYTIVLRQELV